MKLYKTYKDERKTYSYEFYDDNGNKTVSVIRPGENGVTEVDIRHQHYADDYIVQKNNEFLKPELTKKEKKERREWKQDFIKKFEIQHGYKPNADDVKYQMELHFGSRSIVSIERLSDELQNETFCLAVQDKYSFDDDFAIHICNLLKSTSDPYKFEYIYKYYLLAGKKHIGIIAKDLGISVGRVSQIANQIIEIIKKDEKIQKFFKTAKKIGEIDCLEIQEDAT